MRFQMPCGSKSAVRPRGSIPCAAGSSLRGGPHHPMSRSMLHREAACVHDATPRAHEDAATEACTRLCNCHTVALARRVDSSSSEGVQNAANRRMHRHSVRLPILSSSCSFRGVAQTAPRSRAGAHASPFQRRAPSVCLPLSPGAHRCVRTAPRKNSSRFGTRPAHFGCSCPSIGVARPSSSSLGQAARCSPAPADCSLLVGAHLSCCDPMQLPRPCRSSGGRITPTREASAG